MRGGGGRRRELCESVSAIKDGMEIRETIIIYTYFRYRKNAFQFYVDHILKISQQLEIRWRNLCGGGLDMSFENERDER